MTRIYKCDKCLKVVEHEEIVGVILPSAKYQLDFDLCLDCKHEYKQHCLKFFDQKLVEMKEQWWEKPDPEESKQWL